jgi:predicted amidohydrolase YtcJ
MNQKGLGFIVLVVAFVTFLYVVNTTPHEAGMLFINGTIYTLDPHNTIAEAIAIRGDRIVGVGTTADLQQNYQADTVIDLQGKTVMPGFIDGHAHMLNEGRLLYDLDLIGTQSPEQIVNLLAQRVQASKAGEWIFGRGWDQNDWETKQYPSHDLLDRVAPNNPVILQRVDGHALWINQKAIELAGITALTKDPEGGKIFRDARGNATGIFVDDAMDSVYKVVPHFTDEEVESRLKLAVQQCLKYGLTEVHDMGGAFDHWGVDLQTIRVYKKLIDKGEWPIRIYAVLDRSDETWNYYRERGPEVGYGNEMLTVRAIKLFIDGAMGSRGAAMFQAYNDDPGNRGFTRMSEQEMDTICGQALKKGFQVCVHAIGDRGNHIILNEYEKILKRLPKESPSARWRIEHAQVLSPTDIPRFNQLGVLPSMQPTHATSDMYWAEDRLGPERVKGAYAWRSVLQTGSLIVGGSDFPVEGVNPIWGFFAAFTRSDKSGYPQDGWHPEQKMTREEAARCFTQWAAYGSFEENTKGTIEVGKWADLTILSKDIMQVSPAEVLNTEVEMTIVGGKIVYQKTLSVVVQ